MYFLLVFIFLYALFLDKPKGLISRLFISTVIFFGVNTFYFFLSYFFDLVLNVNVLFFIHLIYSMLWFLLIKKELFKKNKKDLFILNKTDLMLLLATSLTFLTFYHAALSFNNGKRLPIFSFTQDAANHTLFVKEILASNQLKATYPLGFHANVWLMETLVKNIIGYNNYDQIIFINVFSIFSVFITIVLTGLLYLVVDHLISLISDNSNLILKLLLALLVVYFGMIIPYYFLADGFYSMWFNQIFILTIIFFFINNFEKKKGFVHLLIPLIVGFIYSYIFFIPALLIFFVFLFVINKKKIYLTPILISFIFSLLTIIKFFQIEDKALWLISANGAFVDYSVALVLFCFIPTITYFYLFNKNLIKNNYVLVYMAISFLIFSLLLLLYQLATTGTAQYSFYKTFSVVMMIFVVFSIIAIYKLLENIYLKLNFSKSILFLYIVGTIYLFWRIFPFLSNYNQRSFSQGSYNFFENNKEKYNAIVFVTENLNNFNQYMYIDQNFSSSQWGSRLLAINGLNSINSLASFDQKMDQYLDIVQNLETNDQLLIIDPARYLQINCKAEQFIVAAIDKVNTNNVFFYPYFDFEIWNKNCNLIK